MMKINTKLFSRLGNKRHYLMLCLVCWWLTGCYAQLANHQTLTPAFDLFSYFNGEVTAWGMVQDFKGDQVRRFEVKIKGEIQGNQLILTEDFYYADGEQSQRIWYITQTAEYNYIGTASDVVGQAVGESVGNALRWRYTMALPVDGTVYHIDFDDWMFMQDPQHVFNRATMRKFGVKVAEVTLFFAKSINPEPAVNRTKVN